jgi:hypothetical protein
LRLLDRRHAGEARVGDSGIKHIEVLISFREMHILGSAMNRRTAAVANQG